MQNILAHPPIIDTERLILRPLTMGDDEAIYAYASDPEVTMYVAFETHLTIEDSRTFIQKNLENYDKCETSSLGIILKDQQELIGCIGYHNWDEKHKKTEIGYVLSKHYWNMGLVSEAVAAFITALFDNSDLMRIEALCNVSNIASARVMEKSGMTFEGELRKYLFSKGKHHDMKMYSILKDEWLRQNNH